jgi:hypothetical protein
MGNKSIDLSGQIFGEWTVIELDKTAPSGNGIASKWICQCECGEKRTVSSNSLRRGKSISCGHEKKDNLKGLRFGRLVVIKEDLNKTTCNRKWICQCDCGETVSVLGGSLKNGRTASCTCLNKEINTKHGLAGTSIYNIWGKMMERCYIETSKSYKYYGARGISVCKEWHDVTTFARDMGFPPEGLTIDRKDVNGNYCPDNCRWADDFTQQNNRSNNVFIEYNDINLTIAQWARLTDMSFAKLHSRLFKWNYPIEQALFKDGNTIQIVERIYVAK